MWTILYAPRYSRTWRFDIGRTIVISERVMYRPKHFDSFRQELEDRLSISSNNYLSKYVCNVFHVIVPYVSVIFDRLYKKLYIIQRIFF